MQKTTKLKYLIIFVSFIQTAIIPRCSSKYIKSYKNNQVNIFIFIGLNSFLDVEL